MLRVLSTAFVLAGVFGGNALGGKTTKVVEKTVGGKKLVVLDNAVPLAELRRVVKTYTSAQAETEEKWGRIFAGPASTQPNAHVLLMKRSECVSDPMHSIITRAAKQFFPQCGDSHIAVYGCAINAQTFADVDMAHVDYPAVPPGGSEGDFWGFTAIWYPHEDWDVHWGGATAFMEPEEVDVAAYTLPLPRRLVIFDSSIRHMATPPTLISAPARDNGKQLRNERRLGSRFSFAYKFVCSNLTETDVFDRIDSDEDGFLTHDELMDSADASPGEDIEFGPLRLVGGLGDTDARHKFSLPRFLKLLQKLKY